MSKICFENFFLLEFKSTAEFSPSSDPVLCNLIQTLILVIVNLHIQLFPLEIYYMNREYKDIRAGQFNTAPLKTKYYIMVDDCGFWALKLWSI